MHVKEMSIGSPETLAHYVETTIALTLFTAYIVVTLQAHSTVHKQNATLRERAVWPILFSHRWMQQKISAVRQTRESENPADAKV